MARDVLRRIRSRTDLGWRVRGDSPASPDRDGVPDNETDPLAVLLHLSHEIRTPLNSMLALSQLLRDGLAGSLNPEQQKYVEVIERNGQNLVSLIGDVFDFSRMEFGRLNMDLQSVDLGQQLRAAASALAPLAEAKGIDLLVNVADLPPVSCDPERLRQVLTNLIGNAIKFTHRGRVTLDAELGLGLGLVVVHVCDTGVGIPEDARPRVFEEFFQVAETGSRARAGGVGLGLAITRRLVRLMGGELSLESTEGVGSRFTFTLPVALPERSSGSSEDRAVAQRGGATVGSEEGQGVAHATQWFRDEPHGSNTTGR